MGGAQTIILSLLRHLPRRGFEIIVAPYDTGHPADGEFLAVARKEGATIAPDPMPWRGPPDWFKARRAIQHLVEHHQIDLVHTHENLSSTLVASLRLPTSCARVATAYGWWERNRKLRLFFAIERRLALPRFDRVCTVAEDLRRKIVAGGTDPRKVRVIHTGLEPEQFAQAYTHGDARAKFGLAEDALVVGTLSRLAPEKGLRHLIGAAHQLLPRFPKLILLIAGTGNEQAALEAHARHLGIIDAVRFAGFVRDSREAYAAMDVFALPSVLPEGLPTSSLEAQAAGLPVIASDIGGTADTIQIGRTGELVAPGDSRALATTLAAILDEPERRAQMGRAARAWIEKEFTMANMIDQVATIYGEAAMLRRAPRPA